MGPWTSESRLLGTREGDPLDDVLADMGGFVSFAERGVVDGEKCKRALLGIQGNGVVQLMSSAVQNATREMRRNDATGAFDGFRRCIRRTLS